MSRIVVEDLSQTFEVSLRCTVTLKELLIAQARPRRLKTRLIQALDSVSFRIADGDRVGFLGHNGSGKSTLLRTIAGIYRPTQGTVTTTGKVLPLFHSGGSFNSELTGRENVLQTAALMRVSRKVILECMDEILDFAGVADYADVAIKYYSRGMATRLAFAVLTSQSPEILLLDEALGGGDQNFRARAQRRLNELMDRSSTLLIASHDLSLIERICTRVLWLDSGRLIRDGAPDELVAEYREAMPSRNVRAA